jgi:multidrug efflux system membrane fusion protein
MKAGNLVKENDTTLVTILEMSPIYVSFGLPEQMLGEVRRFQAQQPLVIRASPDDGSTWTSGRLKFFDNTVDPATGTIKMKAEFPNNDRVLWPGQFVNVQTLLRVEHNRVIIPSRTVQTGPQGKYVWVMDNDTKVVSMRPVQVLRNVQNGKSREDAVIGDGLRAGELVISEGQMRLAPGMKVNVLPGDAGAPGASSMGQM